MRKSKKPKKEVGILELPKEFAQKQYRFPALQTVADTHVRTFLLTGGP